VRASSIAREKKIRLSVRAASEIWLVIPRR
jgi:hypothetical protein